MIRIQKTVVSEGGQCLRIGVDIDGVLADHIVGILPRIADRFGVVFTGSDQITQWIIPLGDSDLGREISAAMQADGDYLQKMPVHKGAVEFLQTLHRSHHIVIVTARPRQVEPATRAWLDENGLLYDELSSAEEGKKSLHFLDVLIDDYLGNILEVLENSDGVGILVDQPWNRSGREFLEQPSAQGRSFVVDTLAHALPLIKRLSHAKPQ